MITVLNGDLYQWDSGRIVQVVPKEGDKIEKVECYPEGASEALSVPITSVNDTIIAPIPNIFLQKAQTLVICAISVNADEVRTTEILRSRIHEKAKPADYVYTETECLTVKDFVNAALLEAKESGDFKGDKGDKGDAYELTEVDKTEITNKVLESFVDVSEVGQ